MYSYNRAFHKLSHTLKEERGRVGLDVTLGPRGVNEVRGESEILHNCVTVGAQRTWKTEHHSFTKHF